MNGRLFDQLAAKGVNIDDIETVTFTHLHPDHVGWNMRSDGQGSGGGQSRATRHAVFDRLEQEGMTIAAGHFPKPGFGKLVRVEGKRIWQAL